MSQHRAIHYFSGTGRRTSELRFTRGTEAFTVSVEGDAAVNETGLYIKMCLEGFRLAQLAENIVSEHLQKGTLVKVLVDWPPSSVPITLLYPHQRFLSPTVRAFVNWIADII
ncbi:TPA: hypothetical protein R4043_005060 [Citrobacter farmeri]|nr:hypothetical protein [Citrobacter farmeri]HED3140653.1 hypothetical protein [Citrobacter farmeri]